MLLTVQVKPMGTLMVPSVTVTVTLYGLADAALKSIVPLMRPLEELMPSPLGRLLAL